MDSNRLDRIDELLESTSAARRIKFDFSEIETTESRIAIDNEPEEMPAPTIDVTPVEEIEEPVVEEPVVEEPIIEEPVIEEPVIEEPIIEEPVIEEPIIEEPVEEVAEVVIEDPVEEIAEEEEPAPVAVAPVVVAPVVEPQPEQKKEKKAKKEKKPNSKGTKILQIALIVIVSIAALWTIMYTVDHTLAAQGISPMFAISETEYDDGSLSFDCIGYKVQFMFDSNDRLTQKCVPAWEDGPNDIRVKQGLLFEVN